MVSNSTIGGYNLRKMIIAGANRLNKYKDIVDELNVFPVPDGDTGTNMSLTVLAAAKEIENNDSDDLYQISKSAASGSLRGARGNSGVILSQLFRGFSKGLKDQEELNTVVIANAFKKGVDTAYKAVMKPKEGTILTVARESADKAIELAETCDDVEDLLVQTLKYGKEILDKTPDMLPVLKQAGVVDAGGQGLIYFIEGALLSINDNQDIAIELENDIEKNNSFSVEKSNIDTEDIVYGYCTEFMIKTELAEDDDTIDTIKNYLSEIGDSLVIFGDEDIIKIHVHTNHPGLAFEKGLEYGSLTKTKVENMREQHTNIIKMNEKKELKEYGFIAVSKGKGISDIFKDLGVDFILEGGQTMNPSTEDILNAIDKVDAKNIFVLPNNKNIILAAEQASKLSDEKNIIVINTKTIPQGISSIISFDENNSIEDNVENMNEAISYVKTAQITYAVRDTTIEDKVIKQGNILGIVEGSIEDIDDDLEINAKNIIDKLVDEDSEIFSIYYGEDVKEEEAKMIADYVAKKYPDCEVEINYGGQPLYYYIFSVE